MKQIAPVCPYCDRPARLVTGAVLFPHLRHLTAKLFWRCDPCDAHVGCHPRSRRHGYDGTEPMGRLADRALRRAKQRAHEAFDPLWKSGEMSRTQAYAWLADAMGISQANCHIGMFDVDQCAAAIAAIELHRVKA